MTRYLECISENHLKRTVHIMRVVHWCFTTSHMAMCSKITCNILKMTIIKSSKLQTGSKKVTWMEDTNASLHAQLESVGMITKPL